jgi:hypothetical protein
MDKRMDNFEAVASLSHALGNAGHQDLEALVTILLTCERRVLENPHFE